jgi:cellulose biosynthesis protein BcsQ
MRTIAIINQKGGCGKTTTSINLAACLARLGQKTLLVDVDPQGHCAVGLAVPEEQIERTIYDCLLEERDGKVARLADIVWQIATDFDLAPSNLKLAAFEQVFSGRIGREDRLRKAIDSVKQNYKWCIIDCPPSVGLITFNALRACDEAIVPVETGYFSLHGLAKMMETLEMLRDRCDKEILIRVLPTLYDTRTKLAREVLSELRSKFREYLMESTVNFNTKLKEAASFGQPITEYDPGSRGYKDFVNLARELMGHTPAEMEPMPMDKMSRPQELVQRAKQLAQLTNLQFGRNAIPASPPAPVTVPSIKPTRIEPAPVEPVGPQFSRMQAPYTEPSRIETSRIENSLNEKSPIELPRIEPQIRKEPQPRIETSSRVETGRLDLTPAPLMTPAAESLSLSLSRAQLQLGARFSEEPVAQSVGASASFTSEKGPAQRESAQPATAPRVFRSNGNGNESGNGNGNGNGNGKSSGKPAVNFFNAAPSQPPKTTATRVEDFYGVKKVGDEVIFAARFERAKKVLIAGDFNNWSPMSTPMVNRGKPGEFYTSLPLQPGRYRYRFVVDGKWMTDPHNKYVEVNQFGELNNVIDVE